MWNWTHLNERLWKTHGRLITEDWSRKTDHGRMLWKTDHGRLTWKTDHGRLTWKTDLEDCPRETALGDGSRETALEDGSRETDLKCTAMSPYIESHQCSYLIKLHWEPPLILDYAFNEWRPTSYNICIHIYKSIHISIYINYTDLLLLQHISTQLQYNLHSGIPTVVWSCYTWCFLPVMC